MLFHLDSPWGATLMPLVQCVQWTGEKTENWGWVDFGPVLSRFWTKVHKISRQCRGPLVLSKPWSDFLCRVSFIRYSPLNFEVVEKPNKCKSFFTSNFFGRDDPDFSTANCQRDLLPTVWQSSVEFCLLIAVFGAWKWSRMQNLRRVGKITVQF